MSSMELIDALLLHTSLITVSGQTTDFGNIFNSGFLAIRASRSSRSLASSESCMSVGKARFLVRRFLVSTKTAATVS